MVQYFTRRKSFILVFCFSLTLNCIICTSDSVDIIKTIKNKRALAFPYASTVGLLIAIAVPIDLPHREVFFSYNFETNYISPSPDDFSSTALSHLGIGDWSFGGRRTEDENVETVTQKAKKIKLKKKKSQKSNQRRSIITRKDVYDILNDNLRMHGFHGKDCLLRSICEVAESPIAPFNGVIGDIMHIIYTPSASQPDQQLHSDYYEAELYGKLNGNCSLKYGDYCPKSFLDTITLLQSI